MGVLSDSNPRHREEGGGEVCPIVTPAESWRRGSRIGRGGMVVHGLPIFIPALRKMCHICLIC